MTSGKILFFKIIKLSQFLSASQVFWILTNVSIFLGCKLLGTMDKLKKKNHIQEITTYPNVYKSPSAFIKFLYSIYRRITLFVFIANFINSFPNSLNSEQLYKTPIEHPTWIFIVLLVSFADYLCGLFASLQGWG